MQHKVQAGFGGLGITHNSNHDAMFDQLFREHLIALYQALNEPVPDYLSAPIVKPEAQVEHAIIYLSNFIHPTINGSKEEEGWDQAGKLKMVVPEVQCRVRIILRILYGYDHLNFYLRFDLQSGGTTRPRFTFRVTFSLVLLRSSGFQQCYSFS